MKKGDTIRILDTAETRKHYIQGMPGVIEEMSDNRVRVIVTDPYLGPAGPYWLNVDAVEKEGDQ